MTLKLTGEQVAESATQRVIEAALSVTRKPAPVLLDVLVNALVRVAQRENGGHALTDAESWELLQAVHDAAIDGRMRKGQAQGAATVRQLADRMVTTGIVVPAETKPELYRHVKTGGVYEAISNAQDESQPERVMVVYRNIATGQRWVRPASEFNDGRFERIGGQPAAEDHGPGWVCLEGMNADEFAAYDYGSTGMLDALARVLDGEDTGEGVSHEPWETLRRRVLTLMRRPPTFSEVPPCQEGPELPPLSNEEMRALLDAAPIAKVRLTAGPVAIVTDSDGTKHEWRQGEPMPVLTIQHDDAPMATRGCPECKDTHPADCATKLCGLLPAQGSLL